jgi:PAS domain S-box-containing protein
VSLKRSLSRSKQRSLSVAVSPSVSRRSTVAERRGVERSSRRFMDLAPQLNFTANSRGRVDYFNAQWYKFLGLDAAGGALDFLTVQSFVHPADVARVLRTWQKAVARGRHWQCEYRIRCSSGDYSWHLAQASPVLDHKDSILAWFGSSTDIHELKLTQATLRTSEEAQRALVDQLRTAREAAEAASRAKTQFLANMSHEIRTPIGVILGFAELLRDPNLSQHDREKGLSRILDNGRQLTKIVNEVLDVSKIEANCIEPELINFDLHAMLEEIEETHRVTASMKGLEFSMQRADGLPQMVTSDPTRIRQIFGNMISNSIKFTECGGIDVLIGQRGSNDEIKLEVEVIDTGIGMSPQQEQRLFEPFHQADASMTRRFGGTGLGLYLAKKFANALGGDVGLKESRLGVGSRFGASIPIRLVPDAQSIPVVAVEGSTRLDGLRVLIVDDSEDNRELVSRLLQKVGAQVEKAEDGLIGVTRALRSNFHVVLMDLQMPRMDGYDAIRELRAVGYTGTVYALTAHALKSERDRCLESGFDDHFVKPIDREVLLGRMASCLLRFGLGPQSDSVARNLSEGQFAHQSAYEPAGL